MGIDDVEKINQKIDKKSVEISSVVSESIKSFIRDLGFPIFISVILIWNSWQMQSYLIGTNERREAQLATLAESIRGMQTASEKSRDISIENNAMLRELRIAKAISDGKK